MNTLPRSFVSRQYGRLIREARAATSTGMLAIAAAVCSASATLANELVIREGHVIVTCPLTVGGRFEAKTSAVTGQIVAAQGTDVVQGSFVVDLRTLDTGIALRNTHLKDNYLEVGRGQGFDAAVLDRIRLIDADAGRAQGKVAFRGMLTLHGQMREVVGTVDISRNGSRLTVNVQFPLRIDTFQFAKPTYLGVGVSNEIRVEVRATLVDASTAGPAN